uniref:Ras-GEF domain-containing protein n=1 Tax=Macrostomum lignano TaxID=282301 RepID=A0A1I8FML1_9PLAT
RTTASARIPAKQAKRTAYALYATYLHRDAPLNLQASLQARTGAGPAQAGAGRLCARPDRNCSLSSQLTLRRYSRQTPDGFVSDILPAIDSLREDLHLQFLASASFGGDLEAGCLATVLEHVFHLRPGDTACQRFLASCGVELSATDAAAAPGGGLRLRLRSVARIFSDWLSWTGCIPCSAVWPPAGRARAAGIRRSWLADTTRRKSGKSTFFDLEPDSTNEQQEADVPPGSQKPPQPPPCSTSVSASASSQAMSSSLDSDGLLRQHSRNLRRQSNSQVVDLPRPIPSPRPPPRPPVPLAQPAAAVALPTANCQPLRLPLLQIPNLTKLRMRVLSRPVRRSPSAKRPLSGHPDIRSVQVDFHAYIMDMDLNGRLAELRKTYDKDFDRLKKLPAGSWHEMVLFSSMSHLRALTILQQLWGCTSWPDCIGLYKSLLASLRGPSLEEFRNSACLLEQFGERLLAWYTADDHVFEFKRLSLSFGFAKNRHETTLTASSAGPRPHPVMNKRRFVDLYSVNMQQTMRMQGRRQNLEACLSIAKDISDYSNNIGVKLKELSRQLVLSKSFSNFWRKSMRREPGTPVPEIQISHLHTCRLYLTREVHMPGLDNYRLRLFRPSMSLASQQQHQQGSTGGSCSNQQPQSFAPRLRRRASSRRQATPALIAVSSAPIYPIESVVHIFDTRHREIDVNWNQIGGASLLDNSGRVKEPLMLNWSRPRPPRMPFLPTDGQPSPASEFAECIRKLVAAGPPAVSAVSAVACRPLRNSADTPAASTEATEAHRRAKTFPRPEWPLRAAVAAEPTLPEQQQQEAGALDEAATACRQIRRRPHESEEPAGGITVSQCLESSSQVENSSANLS